MTTVLAMHMNSTSHVNSFRKELSYVTEVFIELY
jgi:hypothetical protein